MTDAEKLLEEMQEWSSHRNFNVSWEEVREAHKKKYRKLSKYKKRRLRNRFDHWVTRQRQSPYAE